jgi:hypothetical protein
MSPRRRIFCRSSKVMGRVGPAATGSGAGFCALRLSVVRRTAAAQASDFIVGLEVATDHGTCRRGALSSAAEESTYAENRGGAGRRKGSSLAPGTRNFFKTGLPRYLRAEGRTTRFDICAAEAFASCCGVNLAAPCRSGIRPGPLDRGHSLRATRPRVATLRGWVPGRAGSMPGRCRGRRAGWVRFPENRQASERRRRRRGGAR